MVTYRHGDWVLQVTYKPGSPAPTFDTPNGERVGLPPQDETVLKHASWRITSHVITCRPRVKTEQADVVGEVGPNGVRAIVDQLEFIDITLPHGKEQVALRFLKHRFKLQLDPQREYTFHVEGNETLGVWTLVKIVRGDHVLYSIPGQSN